MNFPVGSGNEPELLGMPDCEWVQLLHINCQITNNAHKRRKISKQSKVNVNLTIALKIICILIIKLIRKQTTSLLGQAWNDRDISVKTTSEIYEEYGNAFTGIRCFKGTFSLQVKMKWSHTKHPKMCSIHPPCKAKLDYKNSKYLHH